MVFNSRTGNTRKVAEEVARLLGSETEEIKDKVKRKGFMGYMRTGRESVKMETIDIEPISHDPSSFDLVIIGCPIWAWRPATPIRAFIKENKGRLPRIALFTTQGSKDGHDKVHSMMEDMAGKKAEARMFVRVVELRKGGWKDKVKAFVDALRS